MHFLRFSASVLALATLSACGGGGGSVNSTGTPSTGTSAPTPTPSTPAPTPTPSSPYQDAVAPPTGKVITPSSMQPTRSANDTTEFRQNYVANEFVGALYALDNGWRGQGVTVAVLDDGVNNISALSGQISDLSKDFGYETRGGVTTKRNNLGNEQSDHGTAIAAIIAAKQDGSGTIGIAPDAKIAVLRTSDYNYDTGTETLSHSDEALNYAASVGIKVVNRSLVSQGFSASLRNAVTNLATAGGVVINAAGNSGGDNPIDGVNVDAANRKAWLFVTALDPNVQTGYSLASYSNKAGSYADRTVTAVGTNYTTKSDGTVGAFAGTSSATAQVTGLAATILSKWPQLSGQQAAQVILETAKDIGDPGVDAVFGHGLIDFKAALSPVNPTLSNGSTQTSIAGSVLALPEAISETSLQTALSDVTLIDKFGRDFSGSVAGLVIKPESRRAEWLRRRVGLLGSSGSDDFAFGPLSGSFGYASYRTGPEARDRRGVMTSGELAYQAGRTGVRIGFNADQSLQRDIMGLAPTADGVLAYAPQAGNSIAVNRMTPLGRVAITVANGQWEGAKATATTVSWEKGRTTLRASFIDENGSVLGMPSKGVVSLGRGAKTTMLEARQTFPLGGNWTLDGYGSLGMTRLKTNPMSVVTGSTPLIGTRFGVQVNGPAMGGVLSFGLAQPLTIESGRARLTLGSGYDVATQSLLYRTAYADLSSGRRRMQFTAGYARSSEFSTFRIGLSQDFTDRTTRALASFSTRF